MKNINIKPLIFKTKNGNYYCYDNYSAITMPISDSERLLLEDLEDYKVMDVERLKSKIYKYKLFKDKNKFYFNEDIEKYIKYKGISQLILIVTENCNFRCKYCAYSGEYELNRVHSNNTMSYDVAKKAVDFFIKHNMEAIRFNPNIAPVIGFYGGEPLLNWDLIVNIVNYIKKCYTKFYKISSFTITTNGYLLDKDNIKFMLENKFYIAVSLDGNKENHDRNRVNLNNEGTFDKVFNNIKLLNEMYEYRIKKEPYNYPYAILVTYDDLSNFEEMNSFFKENIFLDKFINRVSKVNDMNTTYYEKLAKKANREDKSIVHNLYLKSLRNKDTSKFLRVFYETAFNKFLSLRAYFHNYTHGTCIPGEKIAVDYNGNFHICEKVSNRYPIGNIENGLDIKIQSKYMEKFLYEVNLKCSTCNISELCNLCFSNMESVNGSFEISDEYCKKMKKSIPKMFSFLYTILEEYPDQFNNLLK